MDSGIAGSAAVGSTTTGTSAVGSAAAGSWVGVSGAGATGVELEQAINSRLRISIKLIPYVQLRIDFDLKFIFSSP
jgi:hypothetical protein